jgi:cell division protein FtsA
MLLHLNRIAARIDGAGGVSDPRGMSGSRLTVDLHAVTADDMPVRNLMHAVECGHLAVTGLAPAPLAAALAVTTADERRLGVVAVDLGAGTSSFAAFAEGHLVAVGCLPVGGNHVTFDVASALQAPLKEAERIKTLYGTLLSAHSDEHDQLSYQLAGTSDAEQQQATRAQIRDIIAPRMDAILGLLADRIEAVAVPQALLGRIVLTGGASQLPGLAERAATRLGRPVRLGRPLPHAGLPQSICGPAFAAVVGLAAAALDRETGVRAEAGRDGQAGGYFGRVGQWIRESF